MSREELLLIKGVISELPTLDQIKVMECCNKFLTLLSEYGDHAKVALALVSVELQNKGE